MTKGFSEISWTIGLVILIGTPAIGVTEFLLDFVGSGDVRGIDVAQRGLAYLPSIFVVAGVGCIICLLSRIETHLNQTTKKKA